MKRQTIDQRWRKWEDKHLGGNKFLHTPIALAGDENIHRLIFISAYKAGYRAALRTKRGK